MKIAVVYSNALGNTVLLTPMLRAIREARPKDVIDLIVVTNSAEPERWASIVDLARCYEGTLVDRVIACDRDAHPLAANVEPTKWDVRIVPIHGEPNKLRDAFLAAGAVTGRTPDWTAQHEVESNMECAWALGYRGPTPALVPPTAARWDGGSGSVALCNGAKAVPIFERKRWAVERWREVARLAHHWTGRKVLVLGGAGELSESLAIIEGRAGWGRTAAGIAADPIAGTCAHLASARLLITTDTFTMHLAASLGTPLVAIFGPTLTTKNRPWMPRERYEIVRSGVDCQPCQATALWHTCTEPRCMAEVGVGDVMAAARRVLKRTERLEEDAA